jgi:hypothetical protein
MQARHGLLEATVQPRPAERYATAHLAALRTAAAVLAARTSPAPKRRGGSGPRSAWTLLAEIAPEMKEWAAFFAAGAGKRAAAEAGVPGAVTAREADDLLRDVDTFLAVAATTIGITHQPVLPPIRPLNSGPLNSGPLNSGPLNSGPLNSGQGVLTRQAG